MLLTSVLVAVVCLMVGYIWFRRRPDSRLPPFPVRPLPIVGNLLSMEIDPRPTFKLWQKQCGNIFSLYLGGTLVVVISGYDLIKEALVKNADSFSDRPQLFLDVATGIPGKGIGMANGSYWKEQRGVAVGILRTLGMGKNVLADKIIDEVNCFTTYLSSLKGKPTDIEIMVYVCVSNVICSILLGERFDYDDKEFQDLLETLKSLFLEVQNTSLVNFLPWLKYLPGDPFKAKSVSVKSKKLLSILTQLSKAKQRDWKEVDDINNFIDAYTSKMEKQLKAGTPTFMDNESLYKIVLDLFEGGTDTISITIYWCVLYLVLYPDVQEKVYQEINDKVGSERPPTMQDKTQLTYLKAVIMETQRLASIVPLAVSHFCSAETSLRGYTIPKGAWILPNLDSVQHDTTTWGEDTMTFRPERFIDDNGKLKVPEEFIPFSTGRRVCPGEALAKMELFLFLSSMIQKFKFLPANPDKLPSADYVTGFMVSAVPYEVVAEERIMN